MTMEKISSQPLAYETREYRCFRELEELAKTIMLRRRVKKLTGGQEFDILDGTDIKEYFICMIQRKKKFLEVSRSS